MALFVQKSGAGKTTTLRTFLKQFLAGSSQVYLVDPVEQPGSFWR